jgi:ribosome-binding protein aMBF1 (putative translation factor)
MRNLTEEEFNRALGERLRRLREQAGLSQLQMAAELCVHANTVSNYERGQGIMTILFLKVCWVTKADAGKVMAEVISG